MQKLIILILGVFIVTGGAMAQDRATASTATKQTSTAGSNVQTVDARQSGAWAVGIDPAKNVVNVTNSSSQPLSVSVVDPSGREPFQMRVGMNVFAGGPSSGTDTVLQIPVGKRFVIENVSAESEIPAGEKIVLYFVTRMDASVPSNAVTNFISLSDQGVFGDKSVFAANHKTLIFAAVQLDVFARPTFSSGTGFATVTMSGHLENLPAVP